MPLRVMLDLETMSTAANAAIVQIGACANDGRSDFQVNVDLASSMKAGLTIDPDTIKWWFAQSDEARASVSRTGFTLDEALSSFSAWLRGGKLGAIDCELWAFPAAFDVTILSSAYRAVGLKEPWHYRSPRCLRTLAAICPEVPRVTPTVAHDALADAKAQMKWAEQMIAVLAHDRRAGALLGAP